jgi:site-specific recombinase XerD
MRRRPGEPAEWSARALVDEGVALLDPHERVLAAMLAGWSNQMRARNLAASTVTARQRQVTGLVRHSNEYPWGWTMAHADEFFADMRLVDHRARSTIRNYQVGIRGFCDYVTDPAYEWPDVCQRLFGVTPTQVLTEVNCAQHVADVEGLPSRRAFTRAELQALFDHVDSVAATRQELGVKGWASAFRDAVAFKVAYAFGTRRHETAMLDLVDFSRNPHAGEFGRFGVLQVRHGKAMRGSAPKRRSVLAVFPWIEPVLAQWVSEVRPLFARATSLALLPSERADRVGQESLSHRLRGYCDTIGLDPALGFHSLRRSYVTHLIEDGWDPRFVQDQAGHEHASTTSIYTCVSSDFRTRTLRRTLDAMVAEALGRPTAGTGRRPTPTRDPPTPEPVTTPDDRDDRRE